MAVKSAIMDAIRRRAQASRTEICGALLGRDGRIEEVLPLVNESLERRHSFFISAREVLGLERTAEAQGRVLLGFYHSHPNGDAIPSDRDLADAVPGYIHIIGSRSGEVRAWRLRDDRTGFDEINLANRDNG